MSRFSALNGTSRLALPMALALCLMAPFSSEALTLRDYTDEQVVANSDTIIKGRVIGLTCRWMSADQAMIGTDYKFLVDQVLQDGGALKTTPVAGSSVTITFAGGKIGNQSVSIPGVPQFEVGEEAVLCLSRKNIQAIYPTTAAGKGVYRFKRLPDGKTVVLNGGECEHDGSLVKSGFFSQKTDFPAGISPDQFIADLKSAIVRTKSMPELQMSNKYTIPADKKHLVFMGDQIPQGIPTKSATGFNSTDTAEPLEQQRPVPQPAPSQGEVISQPGSGVMEKHPAAPDGDGNVSEKYGFQWGVPTPPRTFNIPPVLYTGTNWGGAFENCEVIWNNSANGIYNKYVTSDNNYGHNSRNDFAFASQANFLSAYDFALGADTRGIAVMFNSSGDNIQDNQKIIESDVILNSEIPWTLDFNTVYFGDGSITYFDSTVLHEIGHTFGRRHQFTENASANWHSVMNYWPNGSLHAERARVYMDDAQSIRAAFPAAAAARNDLGIHLFHTQGDGSTNGNNEMYWSNFETDRVAGQTISLSNFIIENVGTTSIVPRVHFYLVTSPHSWSGQVDCGLFTYSSLGTYAHYHANATLSIPANTAPGTYYLGAWLEDGDDNGANRATWANRPITITAATPGVPSGLSATDGTVGDYVQLFWNSSSNAQQYEIFRRISGGTGGGVIATVSTTSYNDTSAVVGTTYDYWVRAKNYNVFSDYSVSNSGYRPSPPGNNHFASAVVRTGVSGTATGHNFNATKESGEPNHAGNAGGKSVWWFWTPPVSGTATINTNGSGLSDTTLGVYTGASVNALTTITSDDDSGEGNRSLLTFAATAGTRYAIAVDGYNGASGLITLNYSIPAPDIALSTANISFTCPTNSATVTVYNTGSAPLNVTGISVLPSSATWLTVSPSTFTVAAGGNRLLTISSNCAQGPSGVANVNLVIANNDHDENHTQIAVSVTRNTTCEQRWGCLTDRQYLDFVKHAPNSTNHNSWRDKFCAGTATPGVLDTGLVDSAEYMDTRGFVSRCYFAIYNNNQTTNYNSSTYRTPDLSGWNSWTNRMNTDMTAGATLQTAKRTVVGGFMTSPEWTNRVGNPNNSAFVDFLYINVLGRNPDPSGKTFHLNRLNGGQTTRRDLLLSFIDSPECINKFRNQTVVCAGYASLLNRRQSPAEFTLNCAPLYAGTRSSTGFFNIVHAGAEYRNRISGRGCPWPASSPQANDPAAAEAQGYVMAGSSAFILFYVDEASTLKELSVSLAGNGGNVYFEVYEFGDKGEVSLLAAADAVSAPAAGGIVTSPRLGVPLTASKLYAIGVRLDGTATLDGNSSLTTPPGLRPAGSITGNNVTLDAANTKSDTVLPIGVRATRP